MAFSELRVAEFLAALGERTPAPASGAAAALTGAFAAISSGTSIVRRRASSLRVSMNVA